MTSCKRFQECFRDRIANGSQDQGVKAQVLRGLESPLLYRRSRSVSQKVVGRGGRRRAVSRRAAVE